MVVHRTMGLGRSALLLAAVLSAPGQTRADVYTLGHGDLAVRYFHAGDGSPGALQLALGLDPGAVVNGQELTGAKQFFMPSSVAILAPASVRVTDVINPTNTAENWSDSNNVPESLGLAQGDAFWNLMENRTLANNSQSPFLGSNASFVGDDLFVDNRVHMALVNMQGPTGGEFTLWHKTRGIAWDTLDGFTSQDVFSQTTLEGHSHWNWAFSEPGDYLLTVRAFGTLAASGTYLETEGTYLFQVVPEPSSLALAGLGLAVGGCICLYRRRQTSAGMASVSTAA